MNPNRPQATTTGRAPKARLTRIRGRLAKLHKSKKFYFWFILISTLCLVWIGFYTSFETRRARELAEHNAKDESASKSNVRSDEAQKSSERPPSDSPASKWLPAEFQSPYQTRILIADFNGPDKDTYRVSDTILQTLRDASSRYQDVSVESLNDAITEQQGPNRARELGNQHSASLVIWGWYGKGTGKGSKAVVTVHVEFLRPLPVFDTPSQQASFLVPSGALERFELQASLPRQLTSLSLAVVGAARYDHLDLRGAEEAFGLALKDPKLAKDGRLYLYRSVALFSLGEPEHALQNVNLALQKTPNLGDGYLLQGKIRSFLGQYQAAIRAFTQALVDEASISLAYSFRAQVYGLLGRQDLADEDFRRADHAYQTIEATFDGYSECTVIKAALGSADQAVECADKAIKLKPDGNAYLRRGMIFSSLGQLDRAYEDYTSAIKLFPQSPTPYMLRSALLIARDDESGALSDCDKAIQLGDVPIYQIVRAAIYHLQGNDGDAIRTINATIAHSKGYLLAIALALRGDIYSESDPKRAVIDLNRAVSMYPIQQLFLQRGTAYSTMRRWPLAITDFDHAARLAPGSAPVYASRGAAYKALGDMPHALKDYTFALTLHA